MRSVRSIALAFCALVLLDPSAVGAGVEPRKPLSAEQIVARSVSARGGLEAWQAVSTLALAGMLYTGKQDNATLPIVVKLKRPNKSRLEIDLQGRRMVQAFDGKDGWKMRRFHGQDIVAPYGPDDVASARAWECVASPPLIDQARGAVRVKLDGTEAVDGAPAYRLTLVRSDRREQHVWVDAKSFLDVMYDDNLRRDNGEVFTIATHYRDYRTVDGVKVPTSIEVVAGGAQGSRKMVFRDVAINPSVADAVFSRPPDPQRAGVLSHVAPGP
jgi:outer membrane lipoprotein-sorting protein